MTVTGEKEEKKLSHARYVLRLVYKAARQSLLKLRTPVTKALSLVLAPVKTREASLRLNTI